MAKQKWYLGKIKNTHQRVYLEDFSFECGWYWGGGYIGNSQFHCHFDGCFLDVPDLRGHPLGNFCTPWNKSEGATVITNGSACWESLGFFLDDAQYSEKEWWRIKDLFKQFYALKKAAEVFQYGGNCSSYGRSKEEICKDKANLMNQHIETVIIPAIRDALNHKI